MPGGFTNTFTYKNFTLVALLSYKFDYKVRLDDAFDDRYTDFNSFSREFVNRWVVPGDEEVTNIPVILDARFVGNDAQQNFPDGNPYDLYNKSTVRIADGDHVRLKNIQVGLRSTQPLAGTHWRPHRPRICIRTKLIITLFRLSG